MSTGERDPSRGSKETNVPTGPDLDAALARLRPRLERMIAVRLEPRIRKRVDAEDVLQEAFLEVARRLEDYRAKRPMPFFHWVRRITGQKLAEVHRRHLGRARRDANREETPERSPAVSSAALAGFLIDPGPSPAQTVARHEAFERVRIALEAMEEADRDVLALRHFEGLSNEEAALELGLSLSGTKKRHVAALRRLRSKLPGRSDVPTPP